jgi:hypothetical protein
MERRALAIGTVAGLLAVSSGCQSPMGNMQLARTAGLSNLVHVQQSANKLSITGAMERSPRVDKELARLEKACKATGASSSVFIPAKGIEAESYRFAYHTDLVKEMNIKRAPADGWVRGTMCINPSGHNGSDKLDEWAQSNTYNIRVKLPDGTVLERNDIPRNHPEKAEYATAIDFQFPYMEGVTEIEAWATGSSTGGYMEGRLYRCHSADQPFDVQKAIREAKAHDAKTPPTPEHPSRTPYRE